MTDYEIYNFESFKAHVHDDERPIERATLSLLRETDINNYSTNEDKSSWFFKII